LTQPERSAATRKALLDSTIACLSELGYDRTTTTEISERAGLSRGAHLHHFRTRAALLSAAVEALALRSADQLGQGVQQLPEGPARPAAALDMVWELFRAPLFQAVLELSIHARHDEALLAEINLLERTISHDAMPMLRRAFGRGPRERDLDGVIAMVLATVRGLVLLPIVEPGRSSSRPWQFCRAQLLALLEGRG
jgi:AcrR family transcriptional regulator